MKRSPTRAFVYPITEQAAAIQRLKQLIKAACTVVCDEPGAVDPQTCLEEADVLVVLISAETAEAPRLSELIALATRAGKRVVGVWSPGAQETELPPALHKYGDAVIPLEAGAVKAVICGGTSRWLTPRGQPRPTPKTPRHKG